MDGNGSVTWYTFSQGSTEVNCSYPIVQVGDGAGSVDLVGQVHTGGGAHFAALNTADYDAAAMCGGCIEVTRGNGARVVVTVVDQCPIGGNPVCTPGHIDLSQEAYKLLGSPATEGYLGVGNGGQIDQISWRFVECPVGQSTIHVRLKEPENLYWNEILVEGHRYPLAAVSVKQGSNWVAAARQAYNYWTPPKSINFGSLGSSPYQVLATDVNGAQVALSVAHGPGDIDGGAQFPSCD